MLFLFVSRRNKIVACHCFEFSLCSVRGPSPGKIGLLYLKTELDWLGWGMEMHRTEELADETLGTLDFRELITPTTPKLSQWNLMRLDVHLCPHKW